MGVIVFCTISDAYIHRELWLLCSLVDSVLNYEFQILAFCDVVQDPCHVKRDATVRS